MSKYKITVENTESGEKKQLCADFYCIAANDMDTEGVQCAMEGIGNTLDIVGVLIGLDSCKEQAFKDMPDVRLAYKLSNAVGVEKTVIDLTEMRRQASQIRTLCCRSWWNTMGLCGDRDEV